MKRNLKEKGITLVALVVTIIILLILAGVTLNLALDDTGIFKRTQAAVDKYKRTQVNEGEQLSSFEKELDKYGDGKTQEELPKEIPKGPNGKQLVTSVTTTDHGKIEGEDKLGNPVTVPGAFKVVEGETIEDGIVIEDTDENQFVWIPVSNIDENGTGLITKNNGEKVEITLGRYIFRNTSLNIGSAGLVDGTPELVQKGSEREIDDEKYTINWKYTNSNADYKESTNLKRTTGGKETEKLDEFVKSVESNKGYYVARYEAGEGTDKKPISKIGKVWNNIVQSAALEAAQKMYSKEDDEAQYVESDLVNSYAWDTAIVYIEKMGNDNYANATCATNGNTGKLKNTGETGDQKCHIFDMAGNIFEFTTEYCTRISNGNNFPCVFRGGCYYYDYCYTADRNNNTIDIYAEDDFCFGFRPLLYLK